MVIVRPHVPFLYFDSSQILLSISALLSVSVLQGEVYVTCESLSTAQHWVEEVCKGVP